MSQSRTRLPSCSSRAVPKPIIVQIGPQILPVNVNPLPARDDALYRAERANTHLKYELSRLKDRIRRLVEDLEWEIKEWEAALQSGVRKETQESIKRKISRLKGACAYSGIVTYDKTDMEER